MLFLLKYLAPYAGSIFLILILIFARAISELMLPALMSRIVDVGIPEGNIPFIWQIGGTMLLVTLGGTISAVLSSWLSSRAAAGLGRDLRKSMFTRVETYSLHEFERFGTASIITRTTNDVAQVQQTIIMMLRMMLFAPMMAVGGIIMAVSQDPPLSVILTVTIPLIFLIVAAAAARGIPLFNRVQETLDRLTLVLRESLAGVRVIRAFRRETFDQQRFDAANRDLTSYSKAVNRIMAGLMPSISLLFNLTVIAVIWLGAGRLESGSMQIGGLMAFIQYVLRIMFSLVMVSMMFVMIPRAAVSARRVREILVLEPEIRDPSLPELSESDFRKVACATAPTGSKAATDCESETGLQFRNVSFRYPGAQVRALSGISFTAGPGTVTAVIGGTGAGKSTLINLIPRFFDVEEGSVCIGGCDVRSMPQAFLREKIGLVPQQTLLFSGTVAENLRFGFPEADAAALRKAAEVASADGFIAEMEGGYSADIARGGITLSGGQRQRLAIARAIVGRKEIYLFDDSFSALDYRTDAAVRSALREVTSHAVVLIVSQRVGTVMHADQIVVLEEGRCAGIGTHSELLEHCPIYREIASSQINGEQTS